MSRTGQVERNTNETKVFVNIELDGNGKSSISTGIGFFDHMLSLLSMHSMMDIKIQAKGDLSVDCHHTVEDIGIAFGQALSKALGDKKSIKRYGSASVPMDEALAFACVDISGRPYLVFDGSFEAAFVGEFETQMVMEFFRAVTVNAGITLHVKLEYGLNDHHKIEAIFKAFARALKDALVIDGTVEGIPSTKGVL